MRQFTPLLLAPALLVAPIAAQRFEGTITMKVSEMGNHSNEVKYMVKGDKIATTMTMPTGAGPGGGHEGRMIIDNSTMTSTILIPMEMGASKGIKMVIDLAKASADTSRHVTVKALGTSETIAGYTCDNYEATDGKDVTRICISKELGMFALPSGGPFGGRGGASTGWSAVFGHHPGFPLRVTHGDGKVMMEVTAVHKGSVSSDEFEIPDGYMDMSGLGRMGRGRGGQ